MEVSARGHDRDPEAVWRCVAQRYRRDAGIGTVVAMMLPFVVVLSIIWTLFFVAWYLLGIPLGPGSSVHLD